MHEVRLRNWFILSVGCLISLSVRLISLSHQSVCLAYQSVCLSVLLVCLSGLSVTVILVSLSLKMTQTGKLDCFAPASHIRNSNNMYLRAGVLENDRNSSI